MSTPLADTKDGEDVDTNAGASSSAGAAAAARSLRERPPPRAAKSLNSNFLENFKPEESTREKRKAKRKKNPAPSSKLSVLDETGKYRSNGKDLCDCLEEECPGCHFPCPKCGSEKCGHECRNSRNWVYESIECDGLQKVLTNPYFVPPK